VRGWKEVESRKLEAEGEKRDKDNAEAQRWQRSAESLMLLDQLLRKGSREKRKMRQIGMSVPPLVR
jgi:hypothetical protein